MNSEHSVEKQGVCGHCGGNHTTEDHKLKARETEMREQYDERYRGEYHKDWEQAATPVVEFLDRYAEEIPLHGKVLDLGSGQGRNTLEIARRGYNAHGLELTKGGIEKAQQLLEKNNLKAHFTQGSFFELPYQDESFDAAVSNQSLHAIPEEGAERAFCEIARVLKDNGLFLLHVISRPMTKTRGGGLVDYYSEKQIRELAQINGLEIEDIREQTLEGDERYVDGLRGMWIVVLRKKPVVKD